MRKLLLVLCVITLGCLLGINFGWFSKPSTPNKPLDKVDSCKVKPAAVDSSLLKKDSVSLKK